MQYNVIITYDINDTIKSLREEVFCIEQGFPKSVEITIDEHLYTHVSLYNKDNQLIAYCRFIVEDTIVHLGRILVRKEYRNNHLGSSLINEAEKVIKNTTSINEVVLHAQYQVVPFYEKNGYKVVGDMFLEENYPHYKMIKYI